MAHYLVRATPRTAKLPELQERLRAHAFIDLQPFGRALTKGLRAARVEADGGAVWEEEDYCSPPLAEERAAVLDHYFDDIRVEAVRHDEGWRRIEDLPGLFPDLDRPATAPGDARS
ncbi:MAG: hypothetical protein ACREH3_00150 [Geminicoccales bacterium]